MSAVVLHFPCLAHVLVFKSEDEWLMYIKVSSVCSEKSHTVMLPLCWKPSQLLLPGPWVSPVCALALNISGQKALIVGSLASHAPPPPPTGLDCGWRREECSYSSHSHRLLSSLCCVGSKRAVFPFCCILPWVEWHLFCCFKTGDVFMSLIWVPPDQGYQQPCWYCMLT